MRRHRHIRDHASRKGYSVSIVEERGEIATSLSRNTGSISGYLPCSSQATVPSQNVTDIVQTVGRSEKANHGVQFERVTQFLKTATVGKHVESVLTKLVFL